MILLISHRDVYSSQCFQWLHSPQGRAVPAKLGSHQHAVLGLHAPLLQLEAFVCWPLPRHQQVGVTLRQRLLSPPLPHATSLSLVGET